MNPCFGNKHFGLCKLFANWKFSCQHFIFSHISKVIFSFIFSDSFCCCCCNVILSLSALMFVWSFFHFLLPSEEEVGSWIDLLCFVNNSISVARVLSVRNFVHSWIFQLYILLWCLRHTTQSGYFNYVFYFDIFRTVKIILIFNDV